MGWIEKEVIEKVKRIDALSYLLKCHPEEVERISGNYYQLKKHDSLKLDHGLWHWYKQKVGGRSAVDFLVKVENMKFLDAVTLIYQEYFNGVPDSDDRFYSFSKTVKKASNNLTFPIRAENNNDVIRYLLKRKISEEIVGYVIKNNLVYQEKAHKNVVFVGKDYEGNDKCFTMRGTFGHFHHTTSGSDRHFPFRITNNPLNNQLHLFEAPIDLLSYITLYIPLCEIGEFNGLSLLGISDYKQDGELPIALLKYIEIYPQLDSIFIHFDNDEAGKKAAVSLKGLLEKRGKNVFVESAPYGKDFNEYLVMLKEK